MSNGTAGDPLDLRRVAAATVVVLAIVCAAALLYYLIDIVLLVFLGVVVSAALQPWHVRLCAWGVPKGVAVLLIYLLFLVGLVAVLLLIGPVVIEQFTTFVAALPETYTHVRASLQESATMPLRLVGQRLPPFEALTGALPGLFPGVYQGLVGFTAGVLGVFAYLATVLAVGFYWTMEVPRLERLVLSFLPVGRRAEALNIWHEIEFKLGAFIRGQGIAMLAIGIASAIGYALIGLPNVFVLGVLAGLLEAVPLIGPVLAAIPAILVALPLGFTTVLLVIGLATTLQVLENNVLIPRIMSHAVGMSALVGLFAVLAFGTLYGILGVFIAIPITAAIQVIVDRMLINVEPVAETETRTATPLAALRARLHAIRQQARLRFRARETRMGIDPGSSDHVVDAADQQIEEAVERVQKMIVVAEGVVAPNAGKEDAPIVEELHDATDHIEQALERVETLVATAQEAGDANRPGEVPPVAELSEATQPAEAAVDRAESMVTAAQEATGPPPAEERGDRPQKRGGTGRR